MTGFKTLVAAALISTISAASALADEPAAFQAQFPNRDVLNGGTLTPAGRMALEQSSGNASSSLRVQRDHSYAPATDTFRGSHGRRHRSR
jgi:hypothetical protein